MLEQRLGLLDKPSEGWNLRKLAAGPFYAILKRTGGKSCLRDCVAEKGTFLVLDVHDHLSEPMVVSEPI